jgi:peptide/nickel transport system substrate-binding protein
VNRVRKALLPLFLLPFLAFGVETIVFLEEPTAAKAVDMIRTGALDLFGAGVVDPALLGKIRGDPKLSCAPAYTAVWHLSFNPVGPFFSDGRVNPFSDPRAREALNWLLDREYIVQEILGGAGFPQILPIRPIFPDYARLAEYARPLELQYSFDPERARAAIFQVMRDLGADLLDGRWVYAGLPVEIRVLIRTDARRPLGDYVARLLEGLGFSVRPLYAGYSEALRILSAPPEEGLWHIYTNSLVVSLIERDEAATFQLNYTPVFPYPPWQYLRPSPELPEIAERLARGDYRDFAERTALMAKALELSMRDSSQVWLAVRAACYPHSAELGLSVDLAAGLATGIWARTLRAEKEAVKVALPSLLSAPLNPVAGSFTVYDQTIIRATTDYPLLPDPYSGLYIPLDLAKAEVYLTPRETVEKTCDWVELKVVPEIPVPKEAWLLWNAKEGRFQTVGEVHPEGLAARFKVVLFFRPDLWEKTWHDGTRFSLGDFLLRFVLLFDRADPQSPVFDEGAVPASQAFRAHFRGLWIRSVDPLVVEVYTDLKFLDAEWIVAKAAELIYPAYEMGPGPWHVLALLLLGEGEKRLALSQGKAKALGVEWANLLSGPSLEILSELLRTAAEKGFVPYTEFLGGFISREEVKERYAALARFFEDRKHFWVGNGPFYVDLVKPVEKVLVLRRWPGHRDRPQGWQEWEKLSVPWVSLEGPSVVDAHAGAVFSVALYQDDVALSSSDVVFVKYLLFDAQQALVDWGFVEASQGRFAVKLRPEVLRRVSGGPARLEVVAALRGVAFAVFGSLTFTVLGSGG